VTRELEDTEYAEDPERHEGAAEILVVGDAEPDVVREDGDHIDNAHDGADVLAAQRRGVESEQVLAGEEHNTGRVETEQFRLVSLTARRFTVHARLTAARHRLGHVGQYRHGDEEPCDVVEDQGWSARLGVFECSPHVLARRRR